MKYSAQHASSLLKQYRDQILSIAARRGATNVRIFGSLATGQSEHVSDIDLLVDMEPGRSLLDLSGLQLEIRDLLGMPIDLVVEGGLSPYLTDRIRREAKPL